MAFHDTLFVPKVTNITAEFMQGVNDYIWKGHSPLFGTSTGSANVQVITLPSPSLYNSYATGDSFSFKAGFSNTGATTLQVVGSSSLATIAVQSNGAALSGGEIVAGQTYTMTYNGTSFDLSGFAVNTGLVVFHPTDTLYQTNTYGQMVINGGGAVWNPPALTGGGNDNFIGAYFPSVGLSNRAGKSAADLWGTYVNASQTVAVTTAAMANSHFEFNYVYGVIPYGLPAITNIPAGPWANEVTSGGIPVDPNYQEMGGFGVNLFVGTAGNYVEGIGVQVHDSDGNGHAAVPARMVGIQVAVDKGCADNTYVSVGIELYSEGTQQTTYAPWAALHIDGGWQNGLDLSGGVFHNLAIAFQNGHGISVDTNTIYFNIVSVQAMTINNVGVVAVGSLKAGTGFGCNGATVQTAHASGGALEAYGAGTNGFDTSGHASSLYAMVVAIRAALVANGIMS